jgi:hypothetical protein
MDNFLSSPLFLRWVVLRGRADTLVAVVGLVVQYQPHRKTGSFVDVRRVW